MLIGVWIPMYKWKLQLASLDVLTINFFVQKKNYGGERVYNFCMAYIEDEMPYVHLWWCD